MIRDWQNRGLVAGTVCFAAVCVIVEPGFLHALAWTFGVITEYFYLWESECHMRTLETQMHRRYPEIYN